MTLDLNDQFEFWVAQNYLDITEAELQSKREAWSAGVAAERKRCVEAFRRMALTSSSLTVIDLANEMADRIERGEDAPK